MTNNSLFKLESIPSFHPIVNKYERIDFWKEQRRYCMEGIWIAGVWMPGELHYYINFHKINIEKGTYKGLGLPFLRDIDWELFYVYTEAIGFSGFVEDEEYTCHREVEQVEKGALTEEELILDYCTHENKIVDEIYFSLFRPNGKLKKYQDAREYLRKTFLTSLGKPLYYNQAKHLLNMSSRGWGKSMSASGFIAHNWLFDGCHDYDIYMKSLEGGEMLKSETNVGAIDAKYSIDLLTKTTTAFEHLPDSHEIKQGRKMIKYPSLLMKEYTGSFAPSKTATATNSKSTINHRTLADNPLVFNGTRPNRTFVDEVGFVNNLLEAWEALENTQAVESFKRLTIYGMGTGGLTSSGAAMYAHEIFYNPEQYGCLTFDDKWENKGKIGFFLPATYALNKYKEGPNLITNEDRAMKSILAERATAKKSPTRTKLMGTIINKPIVPSEIFLRLEGTFFPVQDLKLRLADLESEYSLLGASYKVDFGMNGGKVVLKTSNKSPIREFPMPKNFSMDAPVELFELPKKLADGTIPHGRYIAGWDVIDHDGNSDTGMSLQSMFVMDLWTDRIVAEYTARTYLAEDYYEQARRLLLFYNAICNYESNKKGPYAYFRNANSLHLLCETPEVLKDMNIIKAIGIGNNSIGTNTNANIISLGLNLLLTYYETPAYDKAEEVRNLDILMSPGLIRESIGYSKDINTDRISAMIMLMILKLDRFKITEKNMEGKSSSYASKKFWKKPFNKNSNKASLPGFGQNVKSIRN